MKKIQLIAVVMSVAALAGCQNLPPVKPAENQKTFTAPTYYGKELPSAFFANHYRLNADNGHSLRGYRFGKRHWTF